MANAADGVIVGSAIVKQIGQHGRDSAPVIADFVRAMKQAVLKSERSTAKLK